MGCGSCSTGGGCTPNGCKSNGSCGTGGCQTMEVHDWLSNLDMPANYKPFQVTEIKFKGSRKEFFLNSDNIYLEIGELVAVEGPTGGFDVGHVSLTGELVRIQMKRRKTSVDQVVKKIYRKATDADVEKWNAAKGMEWETMHKARKLALDLRLQMKISDVDYQADKTKATFFYTADGRVDFRELIKKMAESFRIRIEMRQIGMRQEAGRLGGIGSCGRELCCSTWLTNFKTVSTAAARYQNLSLNTLKLAGQCGKLKCCLNYELDTYLDALKDIPDKIENLDTEAGYARHQKTDIFKKIMWFSYQGDENWIPVKAARVKEIMALNKAGKKVPNLKEDAIQIAAPVVVEKSFDYENVVGQDSLTRLDERSRGKNNRNNNQKNNRNNQKNNRDRVPAGEKSPQPNNNRPQQQGGQKQQQGGKQQQNQKQQQNAAPKGQSPQQAVPKPAHVNGPKPQNNKPKQQQQQPQGQKPVVKAEGNAVQGEKPEASKNKNRNNRRKNNNRRNNNNGSENKPAAE
ncbi:PSP1 domain-containing protein [Pedobacter soli]|uniref:Cell fate regulator YaaT, PSP1 superfamily (Controls sporulation, competence, biofilm development) n=1 Tax=Pedobacter soli TaxID=390242 RepID=A0A1G6Q8G7_9SPHI|nr:regulatory iron-sulfur-containing complex subunit RicT [Pedobacter soli]SDC87996.1 Cell fate regulator YaaT, PSP1 superfamily (controls sporulation, competence, biofilm development) [Pedobacter soli]